MPLVMYDKIENILKDRNISKKQLAEKAGIPYSSLISALNRKSESFSTDYIKKIANALNLPVVELLDQRENEILWAAQHESYANEKLSKLPPTERVKIISSLGIAVEYISRMNSEQITEFSARLSDMIFLYGDMILKNWENERLLFLEDSTRLNSLGIEHKQALENNKRDGDHHGAKD